MADSDIFGVYIHHGGKLVNLGNAKFYLGGVVEFLNGFDRDKFGYLDLEEEVEKLGYQSWNILAYKVPRTQNFSWLVDDKDVMCMLQYLSDKIKFFEVYVDEGVKSTGSDQKIVDGKGSKPTEKGKKKVVVGEGSKPTEKGKKVAVGEGNEPTEKGKKVAVGEGNEPTEKGKKVAVGEGNEPTKKGKKKVVVGEGSDQTDRLEDKGKNVVNEELKDSESEDSDYNPEEEEQCDTEDSMGDSELGSDDEEYKEARMNRRLGQCVIDDVDWAEIPEPNVVDVIDAQGRDVKSGFISDYVASDEDVISDSTDDEFDCGKKRLPRILYDPKCDHKEMKVVLGMRFIDGYQCREAIRTWAIYQGYPLHFKRVQKHQFEAVCEPPCAWRCYGSPIKAHSTFAIKVLIEPHTCPFSRTNKLANYKWIARQYLNVFRFRPCMSIEEFQIDINDKYAIDPSRGRLYRAKAAALEMLRGSVKHHYSTLRSYVSELKRVDREGRFELVTDNSIFKALYIGFSALRKGFLDGCRRIIGLDGCFLKTHLGGQLLCAVAKDGNNQMFPIVWAVVEVENEDCWRWFVQILLEELGISDGLGLSFISDQQKGLQNAVINLAPFAEHRNCARHVYCNWKKKFKGATLKNIFWKAVRSTFQEEWNAAVKEMKLEDSAAYDDFMEKDHNRFCKVFVSTQCCSDMVDNNVSETFNGYIVKSRSKYIINMLEDIRVALRRRQYKKLQLVNGCTDRLCPNIMKKLDKLRYNARLCHAHPGLGGKFEVQIFDERFVVSLGNKTCSCRLWDITGIPCVHAMSAIYFMKEDPAAYVHECYTLEKYLKAYAYGLEPINGEKMWPKGVGNSVQPPEVRIMPGRPKTKRKRSQDEKDPKNPSRLRKLGSRMTCQKCLEVGHNSRSCKNALVEKPQKEKGKRGRPRKHPITSSSTASASEVATDNATATLESIISHEDARKIVSRERAQARRGIGILQCEGTGNVYISSGTRANFFPPRQRGRPRGGRARGGRSGGSSADGGVAIQESHVQ